MAGYKRAGKTFVLKFDDDEEYAGLEVEVGSASLGTMLNLQRLSEKLGEGGSNADIINEMMDVFAGRLLRWNLMDDQDQPVPTTAEGLSTQDMPFVMALIAAWTQAIAGVSTPLAGSSPSGGTSLEASLPMDVS